MNKKNIALRVPAQKAEKIRKILIQNDKLITDYRVISKEDFVYFPVKTADFSSKFINEHKLEITKKKFPKSKNRVSSYKDILKLPQDLLGFLPSSFDIIGNIALIKLKDKKIKRYKKKIGEAILDANKNIKTVCLSKPVKGEYRLRSNIEVIAGEKTTETTHKEFGLNFLLDIKKVYFSPRLANERKRVSSLVKKDETVADMFSGVCPFSIMIAKFAEPKKVYALEKNKDAVFFAKKNIKLNKVFEKVEVLNKDSRNFSKIFRGIKIDRVIMNLPKKSISFFPEVLKTVNSETLKIHFYAIVDEEGLESCILDLKKSANKKNIDLLVDNVEKIKSYSPREFYIGIDITAQKSK